MTMDINDMKDTFLANTHESAEIMLDFIRNDFKTFYLFFNLQLIII